MDRCTKNLQEKLLYQSKIIVEYGTTKAFEDSFQECNFILNENGRYTLKKNHKYYGQVQLVMAILNLSKCYVCLYASYDGSGEIITVDFL
ncbi:unnamed protein product [Callosobruchus maculatus]|uniref:Uncharacterized protein n=1 Tax=Callosobruchus maculatus TaxID=64391 RepID=A0A653DWQ6_CALMS|nr:unnamed protein product [Callosobruchus maculatus]